MRHFDLHFQPRGRKKAPELFGPGAHEDRFAAVMTHFQDGKILQALRCDLVVPDQLRDITRHRASTFFDGSVIAHISFADPFCTALPEQIGAAARGLGLPVHLGGTYLCMEGPQLSTRAESKVHRSLGMSVIGMTAAQEAKLAREAELCFGLIAAVTDYDVWFEGEEVTVEQVVANMSRNRENLEKLLTRLVETVPDARDSCRCGSALAGAIISDVAAAKPEDIERLLPLIGRHLGQK